MNNTIRTLILSLAAILLASWGGSGHYIISSGISKFFNQEMQIFSDWVSYIADHASDADYRKGDDPSEGPKHYIDVDNYPEFIANGEISMDLEKNINKHGQDFVEQNGYLPWATINSYNSLVNNLREGNWEKARFYAADLGHYVADGHMPLHLTANYDGQFTENKGIHYRYESQMVNEFSSEIEYEGQDIQAIEIIDEYIFKYIYENYNYVDSILLADDYARGVSGDTDSFEYTVALWEKTKEFTLLLFKRASHSFAELLYTAWIEAGKPSLLTSNSSITRPEKSSLEISPNPVTGTGLLEFNLTSRSHIILKLNSADGKVNDLLLKDRKQPGNYHLELNMENYPVGIYFLNLQADHFRICKRFMVLK